MFNKILVLSLASLMSLSLQADESKKDGNHPCLKIKTACESAGYTKNNHKNKKGLYIDCLNPVLEGKSIEGVTVSPEDVSACKVKKEERKAKKGK